MKLSFRKTPLLFPLLLVLFSQTTGYAGSGSYSSGGSRALAGSNSAGDSFIAGDFKVLVRRGAQTGGRSFFRKFPSEPGIVSGALIERTSVQRDETIVRLCSQASTLAAIIDSSGQSTFSEADLSSVLQLSGPRDLRCAVNTSTGQWIAANLKSGAAIIYASADSTDRATNRVQLPNTSGKWTHIISLGQQFFAFSDNGQAAVITPQETDTAEVELTRPPWSDIAPHDTFASHGTSLLRTGDGHTGLVQLERNNSLITWINSQKINISPCGENGGCGAWLGLDQRWIVAGLWGTYTGTKTEFTRLKVPLVISDATSPGVALVPALNQFLLVGDTEAEIGRLPEQTRNTSGQNNFRDRTSNEEYRGTRPNRYAIWLKGQVNNLTEHFGPTRQRPKVLFSYAPHATLSAATGDVIVGEGRIPEKLPSHWAAVEPQVEFDPILMANEWTPAMRSAQIQPPAKPWWLDSLGLKQAVGQLQKAPIRPQPLRVAVIDSGVDVKHPALSGVFALNEKEIEGNGIDDDGNGLTDDLIGYDFIDEKPTPDDEFGHGTHVAGLIRNTWSSDGTFGGAFNARLKIFRALDARGKSNSIDLSRAIAAAIADNSDVMNCSWGGGPETQILHDAFAAAHRAQILIFSSAGNDAINTDVNPQIPKKFSGVLSVGASTANQTRARFSNWGASSVFLFAPGADIVSTLPDGRFGEKSGTSMASPIAASVGTLVLGTLRAKHPEWSRAQQNETATSILCMSSEKNRLAQPNSKCGSLNALTAVRMSLEDLQ